MTIVEFLTARLDEREYWCTPRAGERSHWIGPHDSECDALVRDGYGDRGELPCSCGEPARVLADIAAKRAILELLDELLIVSPSGHGNDQIQINAALELAAERAKVMRLLASVYADHPDYREEWKP